MSNKIIFSGVQPTGEIHIGNYLGAISQFVANQDEYKSIFSIVDLHAITIPQNPKELLSRTRQVLAIFLASGIDPTKNIIFNQSQVAEHTQLAWILNCTARVGWLNRMTQFKDKAGKNKEMLRLVCTLIQSSWLLIYCSILHHMFLLVMIKSNILS